MEKDFYKNLPGFVCETMEKLAKKYVKEKWFNKAWEEYRVHVNNSDLDDMKMPEFVFNKYINKKDEQTKDTNE